MITEDEREKILNDLFPDNVGGYTRPGSVDSDFPFSTEFPAFIAKDKVVFTLINAVIRQMLSNDKYLSERASSLSDENSRQHTFTMQGDVTGTAAYKNSGDITVTTTARFIRKGMILMWYGSSDAVPNGWAICDGENGTPDLRDRFVVGAGGNRDMGATGGEETHTLTVNEIPEHKHITPYGEHSVNYPWGSYGTGQVGSSSTDYDNWWPYTSPVGGGKAHNNMPPFTALFYIMKL